MNKPKTVKTEHNKPKAKGNQAKGLANKKYLNNFLLLAILLITAIIYSSSFNNEFVRYDDDYYVLDNQYTRDFSANGLKEISASYLKDELPVTLLSFAIDYKLFKLNPKPYHIENLLFHLLNILLVFLLVRLIFKNDKLALIVALLFAVHPFRVESVAWVAERKDMLYSLFMLSSLIIYIKYIKESSKYQYYVLALVLSVLSVLSKFSGVTITAVLLLLDYYFERKFTIKTILEKVPFIIVPIISFIIHQTYIPPALSQMQESPFVFSFVDRLFLGSYSLLYYIYSLFIPLKLSVLHSYPKASEGLPIIYYISPLILVLIGYLIFILIRKLASLKREIVFGILFFLISISLYLHVIPFGGNVVVAERYTYMAYLGLFIIIGQLFLYSVRQNKSLITPIGYIYVLILIIISFSRISVWENSYTLFDDVIENDPNIALAYNNRGGASMMNKNFKEAVADYTRAIELNPKYLDAFCNRGIAKHEISDNNGAIEDLNKAIELNKNNDKAYSNRGQIKTDMKDYAGALEDLNKAIVLNQKSYDAWYNKGVLNYEQKNVKEAVDNFSKAIAINPLFAKAYVNRGNIKGEEKDFNAAISDYNMAIEISDNNATAYLNRGIAKYYTGDKNNACKDWKMALEKGDKNANGLIQQYCK